MTPSTKINLKLPRNRSLKPPISYSIQTIFLVPIKHLPPYTICVVTLNKNYLRYIEIFKASRNEMNEAMNRMRGHQFPMDPSGRKNLSLAGVGPGMSTISKLRIDKTYCQMVFTAMWFKCAGYHFVRLRTIFELFISRY